jgi:hypothetical protein
VSARCKSSVDPSQSARISLTAPAHILACLPVPSQPPTKSPADPACPGGKTSFWLYDPATNAPVRQLFNHTATCVSHPYNIVVRPCTDPTVPVRIRLSSERAGGVGGRRDIVHSSKAQHEAPFVLFGPSATEGDVLPSPKPLPNGAYSLSAAGASGWGSLQFTQDCPCPKKGKKGCMK